MFQVMNAAKDVLLWTATPDSVLRLEKTKLKNEFEGVVEKYFVQQHHDSLVDFLKFKLDSNESNGLCVQVMQLLCKFLQIIQNWYSIFLLLGISYIPFY